MSHYDEYYEEEAAKHWNHLFDSQKEWSEVALDILADSRTYVLGSHRDLQTGRVELVPQRIQDAFAVLEEYHKARLHDIQNRK